MHFSTGVCKFPSSDFGGGAAYDGGGEKSGGGVVSDERSGKLAERGTGESGEEGGAEVASGNFRQATLHLTPAPKIILSLTHEHDD